MTTLFRHSIPKIFSFTIALLLSFSLFSQLKFETGLPFPNKKGELTYEVNYIISERNKQYRNFYPPGVDRGGLFPMDFEGTSKGKVELVLIDVKGITKKNKLVIKVKSCIIEKEGLKLLNSHEEFFELYHIKHEKYKRERIFFEAVKNRISEAIEISFDIVDENSFNINEWKCDKGKIVIRYSIEGIVDPDLEAWEKVNQNSLTELCEFHHNHKRNRFASKALSLIKKKDEKLWNRVKYAAKSKEVCREYIDSFKTCSGYSGKYISDAYEIIEEVEPPPPPPVPDPHQTDCESIKDEWNKFLDSQPTEKEVLDYTDRLRSSKKRCIGDIEKIIMDLFPVLKDSLIHDSENERHYLIQNTQYSPRYKDISHSDGLEIDDSLWEEEHILKVTKTKSGKFKILIRDDLGRETVLTFGNVFEVEMESSDSIHKINIIGGTKPFKIELMDTQTKEIVWTKENLKEQYFLLKTDDLKYKNIYGQFVVRVWDNLDDQPIELKKPVFLEREQPITMKLIGVLGVVVFVIGISLFYYLRKGRRRHQTIFDN